jgi:hypothetical protein
VVAVLTVAILAGCWLAWRRHGQLLAAYWARQIETASEDQIDEVFSRLVELGVSGIPVLADALNADRSYVADHASLAIWDALRKWEALPPGESLPRVAALSQALADRVERFGPDARREASNLAVRLLQWPIDDRILPRNKVLADNERTLRLSGALAEVDISKLLAAQTQAAEAAAWPSPSAPTEDALAAAASTETSRGDSRGLDRRDGSQNQEPRRLSSGSATSPVATIREVPAASSPAAIPGDSTRSGPASGNSASEQSLASANQPARLSQLKIVRTPAKTPGLARFVGREWDETVAWMQRLQDAHSGVADEAAFQLALRGFQPKHLELAKRLFTPDPGQRRRFAEELPRMSGVDATPWLLQLVCDEDADVRWAAMTLLATTGDPALVTQLRQVATEDADPTIRKKASRIADFSSDKKARPRSSPNP